MRKENQTNEAWEAERRKTNRNALIAVLLAAIFLITFFLGFFIRGIVEPVSSQKINEIIKIIDNTSVYTGDKTSDELVAELVKEILKEDKYARYYTPEEYKKLLEEEAGNYSGVGIGIVKKDGQVAISRVYLNSPAYKAGMLAGDVLTKGIFKGDTEYTSFADYLTEYNETADEEDKQDVFGIVNKFFSDYGIGEEIKLKVMRGDDEIEFTLEKANYTVSYVEYKDNEKYFYFSTEADGFKGRESDDPEKILPSLNDDTAYIKLYEFEGDAANQFATAMEYMGTRGKSKLILDLRDNGGGLVKIMIEIASYLINDNGADNIKIIDVEEKSSKTHFSTTTNHFCSFLTDISVIANTNTASASESLIGALRDYGDTEKYGGASFDLYSLVLTQEHPERHTYCTFGKSIMQTTYALKSGGAIKLTTAHIYWPVSGAYIQDRGIDAPLPANRVDDSDAIARANIVLS